LDNYGGGYELGILGGTSGSPIGTFYMFPDVTTYNDAGDVISIVSGLSGSGTLGGITQTDIATGIPVNSAIFQDNADPFTPHITAHEIGHWLDSLYGQNILSSNIETAAIGGTASTGDAVSITVTDTNLSGGYQTISYTVQSGDGLVQIAAALASAITSNSNMQNAHFSANSPSNSSVVRINVIAGNGTTFSSSISGAATETVTLGTTGRFSDSKLFQDELAADWSVINSLSTCAHYNSFNDTYSDGLFIGKNDRYGNPICSGAYQQTVNSPYDSMPNNKTIMVNAYKWDDWAYAGETFAEEFAWISGFTDEYYWEGGSAGQTNPTAADWLITDNHLFCTENLLAALFLNAAIPTMTDFAYCPGN
jgi:hypothetical protein